jgi:transposase
VIDKDEILQRWAPAGAPWSKWVKPVLFAYLVDGSDDPPRPRLEVEALLPPGTPRRDPYREPTPRPTDVAVLVEPLLVVRRVVREQLGILHRRLLAILRDDDVCRRLMTIPGVGPGVALTFRATVDVPARFRNSKAVGAVFGLTPAKYQSGENDRTGAISLSLPKTLSN